MKTHRTMAIGAVTTILLVANSGEAAAAKLTRQATHLIRQAAALYAKGERWRGVSPIHQLKTKQYQPRLTSNRPASFLPFVVTNTSKNKWVKLLLKGGLAGEISRLNGDITIFGPSKASWANAVTFKVAGKRIVAAQRGSERPLSIAQFLGGSIHVHEGPGNGTNTAGLGQGGGGTGDKSIHVHEGPGNGTNTAGLGQGGGGTGDKSIHVHEGPGNGTNTAGLGQGGGGSTGTSN